MRGNSEFWVKVVFRQPVFELHNEVISRQVGLLEVTVQESLLEYKIGSSKLLMNEMIDETTRQYYKPFTFSFISKERPTGSSTWTGSCKP